MIDDIKSKIPVSIDLLLLFLLLVYKKLTKINMPMITARNKMIGNMSTKRIPIPTAIPVHLSSLLAEFLLSLYFEP
jgi:ABC-type microcin C transport system permease subunit YejB